MESNSPRFVLNKVDWVQIGKGLLIAIVGAGLTYLTEWLTSADLGSWTPVVVAGWSVITNIVRKWIAENSAAK